MGTFAGILGRHRTPSVLGGMEGTVQAFCLHEGSHSPVKTNTRNRKQWRWENNWAIDDTIELLSQTTLETDFPQDSEQRS